MTSLLRQSFPTLHNSSISFSPEYIIEVPKQQTKVYLPMLPLAEIAGMNYLDSSAMLLENWNVIPSNMQTFGGNLYGSPSSLHEMIPQQSSSVSNNSTSDEVEGLQYCIIDERKQRRMISNRESARRSRMRKQMQLDDLWSRMTRLRTENHTLLDKFNHVFESHNNIAQENVKLKDEVSQLRKIVNELQFNQPSNFEEIPSNMDTALFQPVNLQLNRLARLAGSCAHSNYV